MCKKFNINERIRQLPPDEAVRLRKSIALMMGRTREHVSRLLNAPAGSKKDFPAEALIKIANYFECKPEELFNIPLEPLNENMLDGM